MKINAYLDTEDVEGLDCYCQNCGGWITDLQLHADQHLEGHLIAGTKVPEWYKNPSEEAE